MFKYSIEWLVEWVEFMRTQDYEVEDGSDEEEVDGRKVCLKMIFMFGSFVDAIQCYWFRHMRSHLWGPQVSNAIIAAQPLTIRIEDLRAIALINMQAEGYTPA